MTRISILILFVSGGVLFQGFFPVSTLKGRINGSQINPGMKLINQSLRHVIHTQQTFFFSKSTTETLKKGVKYVQSQQ